MKHSWVLESSKCCLNFWTDGNSDKKRSITLGTVAWKTPARLEWRVSKKKIAGLEFESLCSYKIHPCSNLSDRLVWKRIFSIGEL